MASPDPEDPPKAEAPGRPSSLVGHSCALSLSPHTLTRSLASLRRHGEIAVVLCSSQPTDPNTAPTPLFLCLLPSRGGGRADVSAFRPPVVSQDREDACWVSLADRCWERSANSWPSRCRSVPMTTRTGHRETDDRQALRPSFEVKLCSSITRCLSWGSRQGRHRPGITDVIEDFRICVTTYYVQQQRCLFPTAAPGSRSATDARLHAGDKVPSQYPYLQEHGRGRRLRMSATAPASFVPGAAEHERDGIIV